MEERLKLFLSMEGLTPSQFADKLGIQRSGVSHLLAGRNKPSFEFINKMLLAFPKINPDWLILGTGKAYRDQPAFSGSSAPTAGTPAAAPSPAAASAPASEKAVSAPASLEAEPEKAAATSTEPDLFFGTQLSDTAAREPLDGPAAATEETAPEPNRLSGVTSGIPSQSSEPDPVAAKNGRIYPRENPAVRPAAAPAREKRIAQITILYTDGTYEVR